MRIGRILCLACAGVAMLSARPAGAQDVRDVRIRLHKAGDTVSIRNAPVVIDHTIEAGRTDSAGTVLVRDLEDGGHIIEAVATGYLSMFDNFNSGPDVRQPVELEMVPDAKQLEAAKVKGLMTDLHFADFDRRRARGVGTFFTRAQLDGATGRPLANLLSIDAGASLVSERGGESLIAPGAQPNARNPPLKASRSRAQRSRDWWRQSSEVSTATATTKPALLPKSRRSSATGAGFMRLFVR
jgi:hypothetical protein